MSDDSERNSFDPDGVGIHNGNIFGFPCKEEDAEIVIIPVPWDVTASYKKGTSKGPEIILEASVQLDFFHPELTEASNTKVIMTPISEEWKELNDQLCLYSSTYIDFLEQGGDPASNHPHKEILHTINRTSSALTQNLKERCLGLLRDNRVVGILGGEHSVPLGLIQALNEQHEEFGILQIDAHADLRKSYEGFEQSHASIMFNVLEECHHMTRLVQVGIRDIAQSEVELTQQNRVTTFFDWDIRNAQFHGKTWYEQVQEIIQELPEKVYISFDIDGLDPSLCPNTGTPVAGGLSFQEVVFLLFALVKHGKTIIGFDLNEVAPGKSDDWDANVGARALWQLVCATEKSRRIVQNNRKDASSV
jgi:agmatinase